MADVFEIDVKQLLGTDIDMDKNNNEIAEQLARINEQLIIKNKRSHFIWKSIGIILGGFLLYSLLIALLTMP